VPALSKVSALHCERMDGVSMYSRAEPASYTTLCRCYGIPAVSMLPDQLPFLISQLPVGTDDSLFSATERLFSVVNGYTNGDATPPPGTPNGTEVVHPERQVSTDRQTDGMSSATVAGFGVVYGLVDKPTAS
jgi:hypothetical protein